MAAIVASMHLDWFVLGDAGGGTAGYLGGVGARKELGSGFTL